MLIYYNILRAQNVRIQSVNVSLDLYKNLYRNMIRKEGGLWCLTPLSTIFQLYRGGLCYCWRKPEFPKKTTDMSQVTDKLDHIFGLTIHNSVKSYFYFYFFLDSEGTVFHLYDLVWVAIKLPTIQYYCEHTHF